MIRDLRKKFILVAMLSTMLVLAAIMGVVNISNYREMLKCADEMTELLAQNDGKFPEGPLPVEADKKANTLSGDEESTDTPPEKPQGDKNNKSRFSAETPFETRYFMVTVNENGEITDYDLDRIAAVDEETAETYTQNIQTSNKTTGFQGIYRYRVIQTEEGQKYVFLDCRREISNFRAVLVTTIAVSVLGLAAVFVLVVIFSRMVFRPVEESIRKQKQFITDATRKQIQRLSGLVQQLVTLSRLDEEKGIEEKSEFCISDAVSDCVQPYEVLAQTREKNLTSDIEENLSYIGDERSIRQMVGILMDNAIKYSSENGNITLKFKKNGKKILLEVYNDAENLPTGKLDVLFERFYRLDSSRNSATGGSGIGLSVAKAIVQAHKGKITAENKNGKGLKITVIL